MLIVAELMLGFHSFIFYLVFEVLLGGPWVLPVSPVWGQIITKNISFTIEHISRGDQLSAPFVKDFVLESIASQFLKCFYQTKAKPRAPS